MKPLIALLPILTPIGAVAVRADLGVVVARVMLRAFEVFAPGKHR